MQYDSNKKRPWQPVDDAPITGPQLGAKAPKVQSREESSSVPSLGTTQGEPAGNALTETLGAQTAEQAVADHYYFPWPDGPFSTPKAGKISVLKLVPAMDDSNNAFEAPLKTDFWDSFNNHLTHLIAASEKETGAAAASAKQQLEALRSTLWHNLKFSIESELKSNQRNPQKLKQRINMMYDTMSASPFDSVIDSFVRCQESGHWQEFDDLSRWKALLFHYIATLRYQDKFWPGLSRPLLNYLITHALQIAEKERGPGPRYVLWREQAGSRRLDLMYAPVQLMIGYLENKDSMHHARHLIYRGHQDCLETLRFLGNESVLSKESLAILMRPPASTPASGSSHSSSASQNEAKQESVGSGPMPVDDEHQSATATHALSFLSATQPARHSSHSSSFSSSDGSSRSSRSSSSAVPPGASSSQSFLVSLSPRSSFSSSAPFAPSTTSTRTPAKKGEGNALKPTTPTTLDVSQPAPAATSFAMRK